MKTRPVSRLSTGLRALIAMGLATLLTGPASRAADTPPERLSYKGFLTDQSGAPIPQSGTQNRAIVFRIYDDPTGGTLIWSEQQTVTLNEGVFSVLLGEGSQFQSEPNIPLSTVFSGGTASDRFIEMEVEMVGKLAPRMQFLTSPYAFNADQARVARTVTGGALITQEGGGTLTVTANADGTHYASSSGHSIFPGLVSTAEMYMSGSAFSPPYQYSDAVLNYAANLRSVMRIIPGNSHEVWHLFTDHAGQLRLGDNTPFDAGDNADVSEFMFESNGDFRAGGTLRAGVDVIAQDVIASGNFAGGALTLTNPTLDPGPTGWNANLKDFIRFERSGAETWHWLSDGSSTIGLADNTPGDGTEFIFDNNGRLICDTVQHSNTHTRHIDVRSLHAQSWPNVPNYQSGWLTAMRMNHAGGFWNIMLDSHGNLGFGDHTPSEAGKDGIAVDYEVMFSRGGQVYAFDYLASSDRRLKENIESLESNVLGDVLRLQPVRYSFKSDDASEPRIGFIAQDVEEVFPELVADGASEDGLLSLNYSGFGVLSVAAIKELNEKSDAADASHLSRIDALESENSELKSQLDELQAQLAELARRIQ